MMRLAVTGGDENAGWMYTMGHKLDVDRQLVGPEDHIVCEEVELCTLLAVLDALGGSVCARTCAPKLL